MKTEIHGLGLLGTGIMGRRMLAAVQAHPRFRAVALWDPQPQALQSALQAAPGAHAAASLEALVADPGVDLVYVASPPGSHWHAVQAVLKAGRACLCEKPLTHDIAQAQALRDAVLAAGLPFAVNFPFARSAASLGLVELVRSGALGDVLQATITLRFAQWPRPWQAGASGWLAGSAEGGFTREVLSHFVFLAWRLFGPAEVQMVQIQRAPGQAETALRATLRRAALRLEIDAAVAGTVADQNRFGLVGTRGHAALVDWARLEHDGIEVVARSDGTPRTLDALARMLDGHADHGLATADEALATVRCIEGLLAAP
jgi:predicted dehydrogenase